ncbi:DUF3021 family protein [Intestinimonas sp. HCP28S3_D6]|uniref:DUF3021 family protein n=1 Tax=Intestinimonas sp. HCP28S3_D6 TaxID=3438942 RepID=UPI003F88838F
MLFPDKRQAAKRGLAGGLLGAAGCLLLAFLTQPGALFTGSLSLDFTFCYNAHVPEALGAALGLLLWSAFGAEVGVATLPFADDGPALVRRTFLHFAAMAATLSLWVLLNFQAAQIPFFLLLLALVYLLIWLGRWVGWYAEVAAIRERLGLSPGSSPLKWKETLPYAPFALFLCLLLPAALSLFDAPDVPVLTGLVYLYLLLPVGSFCSGLSLAERQGLCPLYPLLCALCFLAAVPLVYNASALPFCAVTLCASGLGELTGWLLAQRRGKRK